MILLTPDREMEPDALVVRIEMTRSTRFVLVCCCSIAVLTGTPRLSFADRSRGVRAAADIAGISNALAMYVTDTGGAYPTQAQGLAALSARPDGMDSSVWYGPYLERGFPKDPWGNDYVYVIPGKNNKLDFDLYSLGEDGQSATGGNDPDDVNNWDPESHFYYRRERPVGTGAGRVALLLLAALVIRGLVLGYRNFRRALTEQSD